MGVRRSLRGVMLPVLLMSGCLLATGCAELQEAKIDLRNRYIAREAWKDLREVYCEMNFEKDFGRGFREGYFDVAAGGNGCPPVIPPERYWSVRYMSTEGRARTEAWFSGYRYGAMVAEQDGVGIFMELPSSLPIPQRDMDRPQHGPDPPPDDEVIDAERGENAEAKQEAEPSSEMESNVPAEPAVPPTPEN
ncbi:hypothetical protein K2Y11_10485 [bacterium]|nr:hypothetical protein [bacterium]